MIQNLGDSRLDNAWAPDRVPMPDDYLLVFEDRSLAVRVGKDDGYTFLRLADTPALGMDDCEAASYAEGMSRNGDNPKAAKSVLCTMAPHSEGTVQDEATVHGKGMTQTETSSVEARAEQAEMLGLGAGSDKAAGTDHVEGVAHGTRGSRAELTYYFSLDGTAFWGIGTASQPWSSASQPDNTGLVRTACCRGDIDFLDLPELRRRSSSNAQMLVVYTAWHLSEWYRTHRLCGVCGTPLRHADEERALQCPSCSNRVYPRINPAVIVGVCDPSRGRIVLTRYARNRGVTYDALIAGFAEIGETFEQCVAREVREEVGLAVKNIRYAGSQPWGIASDLLAGFWCEVDGDATLKVDESELSRAVWAAPSDIVGQPDDLSLTNWMMCSFRDGTSPFGPQTV